MQANAIGRSETENFAFWEETNISFCLANED